MTANMTGPSATPSKSKGKQPVVSSEESDADRSLSLKDVLIEPEGVYRHTRTCMGMIAPVNYNLLARGIEVNNEHSTIIESQSSNYIRGQPPLVTWRERPRRWPSDSKSRPESNGNNSI